MTTDQSQPYQSQQAASQPRQVTMAELTTLVGTTLGPSDPVTMSQQRIDEFAAATEDRQWLHVDPERAASGPFGGTIAHGYLTLSMGTVLLWSLLEVVDAAQVVNYGLGKLRFPAPVPVGAQLRLTAEVQSVDDVTGGSQLTLAATFLANDQPKPVCVAELLFRYYRGRS